MNEQKKKLGEISSGLLINMDHEDRDHSAHDQMEEQLSEYDKELFACWEQERKKYTGDFYIVVITKKEKLLANVIRNYFFSVIPVLLLIGIKQSIKYRDI